MTTITCKIPSQLDAKLEAEAKERRVSKSTIVREALENQIKRSAKSRKLTAYELSRHLSGIVKGGPVNLATNPSYLEGMGE
jgi:hypothetical protein